MLSQKPNHNKIALQFKDPPPEYGIYPNWWWEGSKIDKNVINYLVKELKRIKSYGTMFYIRFHNDEPYSINPPYGSPKYYELMEHAINEHKKHGMVFYFSEWTGQNPIENQLNSNKLIGQRLKIYEKTSNQSELLSIKIPVQQKLLFSGAYKIISGKLDIESYTPITKSKNQSEIEWNAPEENWILIAITSYNTGLDWVNKEVGTQWFNSVWVPYMEKMPEHIGNTFKGYIQDELDVLDEAILFSPILLKSFKEIKGYDPIPYLIGLFHDIGDQTEKIRCDYYGILSNLLEKNVYKHLFDLHEQHNMIYATVAIRGRQDMLAETNHFGDLFKLMKWYHFPGNEDPQLDERIPLKRRFIDAKLSSSAAHIFNKERVSMCGYWGVGWGATLEEHVKWTNENWAYGLNLYDPHGIVSGLSGGWYEWVPPTQIYQPYTELYPHFADYVRRLSYALSQGTHCAEVGVLFPTTAIHAGWTHGNRFSLDADITASTTYTIADSIYSGGVDFNFIDEESLENATIDNGSLCISGIKFRAIVLPPISTIRLKTLEKLATLYQDGGIIISFQKLPSASAENGRNDPALQMLLKEIFGMESSENYNHSTYDVEDHFINSIQVQSSTNNGKSFFVPGEQNKGSNASTIDLPTIISSVLPRDISATSNEKIASTFEKDTHLKYNESSSTTVAPITRNLPIASNIYFIHKKVDESDIYFLYNTQPEQRSLDLTFKVMGEPSILDPKTGKIIPIYRFEILNGFTRVRFSLDRYESILIIFTPPNNRPEVISDNFDNITSVKFKNGMLKANVLNKNPGLKSMSIRHEGKLYSGEIITKPSSPPIHLTQEWNFQIKPNLSNKFGNYYYPKENKLLSPQARKFKYKIQPDGIDGINKGWHKQNFNHSSWEEYTYSFGPYWNQLDPIPETFDSPTLSKLIAENQSSIVLNDQTFSFHTYSYSEQFGHQSGKSVKTPWGGLQGVPETFIYFNPNKTKDNVIQYLVTTVATDKDTKKDFLLGINPEIGCEVLLNNHTIHSSRPKTLDSTFSYDKTTDAILPLKTQSNYNQEYLEEQKILPTFQQGPPGVSYGGSEFEEYCIPVSLKQGVNKLIIRFTQAPTTEIFAYAVFTKQGHSPSQEKPPIPRLKWFNTPETLSYDIFGETIWESDPLWGFSPQNSINARPAPRSLIGWYNFYAPPGTHTIKLSPDCKEISVWVNGNLQDIKGNEIKIDKPSSRISKVTLKMVHSPGKYAGAAFESPIEFDCGEGLISLGDWSEHALDSYSGGATYTTDFELWDDVLNQEIFIDIGQVKTIAEIKVNDQRVGVCYSRPNKLNISKYIHFGANKVEITVYNTLANHYSAEIPSRFVQENQTVSGLIGPVTISFYSPESVMLELKD